MNIIVGLVIVIFILICIGIYFYTQSTQDGTYRYITPRGNFYVTLKGKSVQLIERDTKGPFIYTEVEGGMNQIIPDSGIIIKFVVDKKDKINMTLITSADNVVQANYTLDKISDKILTKAEADSVK